MRGNDEKVSISFHVNWLWRIPYSPSGRKDKNIGSPITQVRATYDGGGVDDEDDDVDGQWDDVAGCPKICIFTSWSSSPEKLATRRPQWPPIMLSWTSDWLEPEHISFKSCDLYFLKHQIFVSFFMFIFSYLFCLRYSKGVGTHQLQIRWFFILCCETKNMKHFYWKENVLGRFGTSSRTVEPRCLIRNIEESLYAPVSNIWN